RLAHDAVFVVARAQFGRAQPERAFAFIGVAGIDQGLDGLLDPARGVERAFQIVVVELQAESLQVQILFASQVSDGKHTDVVQAVDIARGGDRYAVRANHGGTGLE